MDEGIFRKTVLPVMSREESAGIAHVRGGTVRARQPCRVQRVRRACEGALSGAELHADARCWGCSSHRCQSDRRGRVVERIVERGELRRARRQRRLRARRGRVRFLTAKAAVAALGQGSQGPLLGAPAGGRPDRTAEDSANPAHVEVSCTTMSRTMGESR